MNSTANNTNNNSNNCNTLVETALCVLDFADCPVNERVRGVEVRMCVCVCEIVVHRLRFDWNNGK